MKITVFDTHDFEKATLSNASESFHFKTTFLKTHLDETTAALAKDQDVVCCFVNDKLNLATLAALKKLGVRLIALRSAGFNHVDLKAAADLALPVVRVPDYSPHAVAEYATALLLMLNRKLNRACARVHELNFSLEGLVGFDMFEKTVGVIGTGKIGTVFSNIMLGFGCKVLAFDTRPNEILKASGVKYVDFETLCRETDVISLHVPLASGTRHIIGEKSLALMKREILIINTGRGALIDTKALIGALKSQQIGGAALDVYEEEEGVFFEDRSDIGIDDDTLARLLTFPNVIVTSHQAFLTKEALQKIAATTFRNINEFAHGTALTNEVKYLPERLMQTSLPHDAQHPLTT